jgi:hypothetical protein
MREPNLDALAEAYWAEWDPAFQDDDVLYEEEEEEEEEDEEDD